jgi:hypothetical protein
MAAEHQRLIRSYHRAFHFELELYTLGNIRLWRPVPARALFYFAGSEVVMLLLTHVPLFGASLSQVDWSVLYVAIPVVLAWLLTVAKIEGRRFHVGVRAWSRHVWSGKRLVGAHRSVAKAGGCWRLSPVVLIGDGRDGTPPSGLRLKGPGRVLLRYPCRARADGKRLTVAQSSMVACDPAKVLELADGCSVRFVKQPGSEAAK